MCGESGRNPPIGGAEDYQKTGPGRDGPIAVWRLDPIAPMTCTTWSNRSEFPLPSYSAPRVSTERLHTCGAISGLARIVDTDAAP